MQLDIFTKLARINEGITNRAHTACVATTRTRFRCASSVTAGDISNTKQNVTTAVESVSEVLEENVRTDLARRYRMSEGVDVLFLQLDVVNVVVASESDLLVLVIAHRELVVVYDTWPADRFPPALAAARLSAIVV